MVSGAVAIAETVQHLGIDTVFGIVGIPVVDVANALIEKGVRFVAFRNEQAASYAASIYGYLTNKPGVLLVVGGPGIIHALAGVYNANSNCWPLLVLAGSASFDENHKGGFQELDQVSLMTPQTKFAARPFHIEQVPRLMEQAYRTSFFGTPGAAYLDLPANIIQGTQIEDKDFKEILNSVVAPIKAPKCQADSSKVEEAAKIIANSKKPLVIIGKGSAMAEASEPLENLVFSNKLPFLPTPMGKGVLPDDHPLNVSSARSLALASSDVIVLCGARLNWILHNGERFNKDCKIIQIDTNPEQIGYNSTLSTSYGLMGSVDLVVQQLSLELSKLNYKPVGVSNDLNLKMKSNTEKAKLKVSRVTPNGEVLGYHRVYEVIKNVISESSFAEKDVSIVSEGANTMDISRTSFPLNYPKKRLDAGTNATMGVGIPYAIAAKIANPGELVLALEGDSAFGFTGMELETIARNKLGIIIVVMNNSGIYHGSDPKLYNDIKSLPSTALSQNTRYDLVAEGLGIHGVLIDNETLLRDEFQKAIEASKKGEATLLNVIIDLGLKTKLSFGWQKKSKL